MTEQTGDKLLKIRTAGRDDSDADQHKYPYEPTPYSVLERFADSGYIGKKDLLLDYGCGKGRVGFFLSYQVRCQSIGIEYNERIYQRALENLQRGAAAGRVSFECCLAQDYKVPDTATCFYFFNPFSVELLQEVMAQIITSYYENQRRMLLFFYYPSDEYMAYLMTEGQLTFFDEIDCEDLFEGNNQRERIVIFEMQQSQTEPISYPGIY